MIRWFTAVTFGLALLVSLAPADARSHQHRQHVRTGKPGVFNYYVLSLSWSPQHCATQFPGPTDPQCAPYRQYGFVVHGLWPQYDSGFPQSCTKGGGLDQAIVNGVLDIMPSPMLVRHEWDKHGTCSGMAPDAYFAQLRAAYSGVKIPAPYQQPTTALRLTPRQIKEEFEQANAGLQGDSLAVLCAGAYLQEVRVCLDKDLHARACGHDVRDQCRGSQVTVRPVR
ncbi:MAG: ribonuclease T2 family protein [Gaiellaceae bacterium]